MFILILAAGTIGAFLGVITNLETVRVLAQDAQNGQLDRMAVLGTAYIMFFGTLLTGMPLLAGYVVYPDAGIVGVAVVVIAGIAAGLAGVRYSVRSWVEYTYA